MTTKKNVVKVMIGGDEYPLRSERSEEYTRAVADHVDRALREALSVGTRVESHKAAVLAALAVTDELFQARVAEREMASRLSLLTAELSRLLPLQKRTSGAGDQFTSPGDGG